MIKLVAIDMDGTLLDDDKTLPQANISAIRQVAESGVKVVLCTGRQRSGILPYLEALGLGTEREYVILNNGCLIYQTDDWQALDRQTLSYSEMKVLAQVAEAYSDVDVTFIEDKHYYSLGNEVPQLVKEDAELVFDTPIATSIEAMRNRTVYKVMYMANPQALDQFQKSVEQVLSKDFSLVRSQTYLYEALPKGITKSSGLATLCQRLNITPDEVMAIGDAANDVEMLDFAKYSVAMGNASQTIKNQCRYVTKTNNEAGVAHALNHWVLEQD